MRRSGPTGNTRIIQIHPTRRCNLQCRHCYSSSGPRERGEIDPALLFDLLDDGVAEGYGVVSFSGGEPVLYPHLADVLDGAGERGMFRTLTSNGMLLDGPRLDAITGRVDLLAISLDGVPGSHDALRGDGAFAAMERRLQGVRAAGISFGFIFTLTQDNVGELPWVARFAVDQGASLLQVHPLEEAGRAAIEMIDATPRRDARRAPRGWDPIASKRRRRVGCASRSTW